MDNAIKLVTPIKTIDVTPTRLEFRDDNKRGFVLHPDGKLMIFWGFDEFYEEHMIDITDIEDFNRIFQFLYRDWESHIKKVNE